MLGMNKLPRQKRVEILSQLVEGMSLRAVTRTTGVSINTVTGLPVTAGKACSEYMDENLRNLTCRRIQVDEIWAFCYAKAKNVPEEMRGKRGVGDLWTWVAIDPDSKLVPSYFVGDRSSNSALQFVLDIRDRIEGRFQLTSDGWVSYNDAVRDAFVDEIDYGQLVKQYADPGAQAEASRRYSPSECIGAEKRAILGNPDPKHISTSIIERQNLTMRMGMRRFTRLTNAFSKKAENHVHAISLHFMYYNFCRIHQTIRMSPAMRAGVTQKLWDVVDLVRMIEDWEARQVRAAA